MTSRLTATFEINGEQVPAADCDWQFNAPCGCAVGLSVVERGDEFLGTEEQAWKAFEPRARDRKRMISQGYTLDLVRRSDGVEAYRRPCTHRTGGES